MSHVVAAIIAYNGGADLARAVADLVAVFGAENTLVIDNASVDRSTADLPAPTLRLPANTGFAGGADRALNWAADRHADGLLLLNQDARLSLEAADRLRALLDVDPNCGAVFATVVNLERPFILDGLCGRRNFRHKLTTGLGAGRPAGIRPAWPRAIHHGHGAAMLLRVAAARGVGGFDRSLFAYHEEVDLCWRLTRAHWGIWLEPRAIVPHRGPSTPEAREVKAYLLGRNSLLVARRNGGRAAWARVACWALAASLLYYGPRALVGDREARALLAGWRDGLGTGALRAGATASS